MRRESLKKIITTVLTVSVVAGSISMPARAWAYEGLSEISICTDEPEILTENVEEEITEEKSSAEQSDAAMDELLYEESADIIADDETDMIECAEEITEELAEDSVVDIEPVMSMNEVPDTADLTGSDENGYGTVSDDDVNDPDPSGLVQPSPSAELKTPEITADISKDEKSAKITIIGTTGYICYTLNGKKPSYSYGMPGNGTECVRNTSCSFKVEGEAKFVVMAMGVTPDGKKSTVAKKEVILEPQVKTLMVDGPTRVVPGKTASYKVKLKPAYTKPKNLVWSLEFPSGSAIEEFVTINEKTGKVSVKKNNMTTSPVTLSNNPSFFVYASSVDAGVTIRSDKYKVMLASVPTVRSMKFPNKSITLQKGSAAKTYRKTDEAYRGKYNSGLIIFSPNDDDPMTDTEIANNIVFETSDESVADVDKYGNITAKKAGKAVIKAYSDDRLKSASMKVTVVQEITGNPVIKSVHDRYVISQGKKMSFEAEGTPKDARMDISWSVAPSGYGVSVSKKGVVSVSKGATTGDYMITAADALSGKSASHKITVTERCVSKINMSSDAKSLLISRTGSKNTASFSVFFDTNEKEYAVTTDRPGIVEVSAKDIKDKGCSVTVKATGYASGTAKVSVRSTDGSGKSVTCTVTVINEDFRLELSQDKDIDEMYTGTSLSLKGVVYDSNNKKISRKISWGVLPAGQGVTVNGSGKITAAKNAKGGKYRVSCAINNQLQYAEYDVFVYPRCTQIMVGNDYDPKTDKITSVYYVGLNSSPSSELTFYNGVERISLKPLDKDKPITIKNSKPAVADAEITERSGRYYLTLSGKSKGSTKITLIANDGSKTSRTFTVNVE